MQEMTFARNCLIIAKENFQDFDKSMNWLNKCLLIADTAYKRAFLQGTIDYVHFVCDVPYTPKLELKLPELTFMPTCKYPSDERRNLLLNRAMPTWLVYNVVTGGCNDVC